MSVHGDGAESLRLPLPDGSFLAGADSETWTPDQWSIFGPDGRWLGVLPRDVPVFFLCRDFQFVCWIDRDFLLVVGRDEFDAERVEAYRIRRDSPNQ